MKPTKIFEDLKWEGETLASLDEYLKGDQCVGSIYEALKPQEIIQLSEGCFQLDEDLDPHPVKFVLTYDNGSGYREWACTPQSTPEEAVTASDMTWEQYEQQPWNELIEIVKGE